MIVDTVAAFLAFRIPSMTTGDNECVDALSVMTLSQCFGEC